MSGYGLSSTFMRYARSTIINIYKPDIQRWTTLYDNWRLKIVLHNFEMFYRLFGFALYLLNKQTNALVHANFGNLRLPLLFVRLWRSPSLDQLLWGYLFNFEHGCHWTMKLRIFWLIKENLYPKYLKISSIQLYELYYWILCSATAVFPIIILQIIYHHFSI